MAVDNKEMEVEVCAAPINLHYQQNIARTISNEFSVMNATDGSTWVEKKNNKCSLCKCTS